MNVATHYAPTSYKLGKAATFPTWFHEKYNRENPGKVSKEFTRSIKTSNVNILLILLTTITNTFNVLLLREQAKSAAAGSWLNWCKFLEFRRYWKTLLQFSLHPQHRKGKYGCQINHNGNKSLYLKRLFDSFMPKGTHRSNACWPTTTKKKEKQCSFWKPHATCTKAIPCQMFIKCH